jgi:hypothetical protein
MATANPERGEVDFPVKRGDGGVEKNYVLKLSINAAVALQKKLKKPMAEIVGGLDKMDFEIIREIAFMLLQKHHAEEVKTPEAAGDVVDDGGGVQKFALAFQSLIAANQDGEGNANPQAAQGQSITGKSTSTLDAPA